MQIVSKGDSLYEMLKPVLWEKKRNKTKKNILNYFLLKVWPECFVLTESERTENH